MDIENLKKLTVLYVEDEEEVQKQFANVLKKVFSKVLIASNGQEGVEVFQKNQESINFIISDIQMPILNGLDMIEKIKEINPEIPAILVTSHGEFDYFMRANDLGVYRYIQKPLDVSELFEAVKDFQNGLVVKKIEL